MVLGGKISKTGSDFAITQTYVFSRIPSSWGERMFCSGYVLHSAAESERISQPTPPAPIESRRGYRSQLECSVHHKDLTKMVARL